MQINLAFFFLFTYILSWTIWIPSAIIGKSNQLLFWIAGFAPTLISVLLTIIKKGINGAFQLLRLKWQVKPIWYFISLLGTPLVIIIALGLHVLLGGDMPKYADPIHLVTTFEQFPISIIVFLYIFIFTALGEEYGWRAYALPRLQERYSHFTSSSVLGFVWALWHLPLFWMAGDFHQQLPFI